MHGLSAYEAAIDSRTYLLSYIHSPDEISNVNIRWFAIYLQEFEKDIRRWLTCGKRSKLCQPSERAARRFIQHAL